MFASVKWIAYLCIVLISKHLKLATKMEFFDFQNLNIAAIKQSQNFVKAFYKTTSLGSIQSQTLWVNTPAHPIFDHVEFKLNAGGTKVVSCDCYIKIANFYKKSSSTKKKFETLVTFMQPNTSNQDAINLIHLSKGNLQFGAELAKAVDKEVLEASNKMLETWGVLVLCQKAVKIWRTC